MNSNRLPSHSTQEIDHTQEVTFSFAGREMTAYAGDTVAAALYAAGVRIFSRSFSTIARAAVFAFQESAPTA